MKSIVLILISSLALWAQGSTTVSGSRVVKGTVDNSGAAHTLIAKAGTIANLPSTCTTGEEYFATDATAGANKYYCTATNTWTQNSATGGPWIFMTQQTNQTSNTTVFTGVPPCGAAGAASVTCMWVMPASGTVTSIAVNVTAAAGAGNGDTFTVQKCGSSVVANCADTTLTCTISGASQTQCTGTGSSTFAAGDGYIMKSVSTTSAATFKFNASFK